MSLRFPLCRVDRTSETCAPHSCLHRCEVGNCYNTDNFVSFFMKSPKANTDETGKFCPLRLFAFCSVKGLRELIPGIIAFDLSYEVSSLMFLCIF